MEKAPQTTGQSKTIDSVIVISLSHRDPTPPADWPVAQKRRRQKMVAKFPVVVAAVGIPLTFAWVIVLSWYPLHLFVSVIESLRLLVTG